VALIFFLRLKIFLDWILLEIKDYWVENYKDFMFQLQLMYAVYDKLDKILFKLGVIVEAGAIVENEIEKMHMRIFAPFFRSSSSVFLAALSDSQHEITAERRSEIEAELDEYQVEARDLMSEMAEVVSGYMKALMYP